MASSSFPVSSLPWISALLLGATAHVGWLVHSVHDHTPPTVKVVTAAAPECPTPQAERMPPVIVDEAEPHAARPMRRSRHDAAGAAGRLRAGSVVNPREAPREIPGSADAIECPSEHHCIVQRAFVDSLLEDAGQLSGQARVVPSIKDGETHGFKLYGIRDGSLPKLLGLKNGDLLTAINDTELTSIDACMSVYTKMRRTDEVELTLERKGETITKRIEIR